MHLEITLYKHYLFYYNILYTFIQESLKMGFLAGILRVVIVAV